MNNNHFHLDKMVRELALPVTYPLEHYQHEKSRKHPRKRRSINPMFMPELRVMKHDIRRKYGEMFVNVTNYHDIILFSNFFHDFCRPDCSFIKISPTNNEVNRNINKILFDGNATTTVGLKEFIEISEASFQMVPDQIVRLQESQIRIRQGSQGSMIFLKGLVKGIKIFTAYPISNMNKKCRIRSSCDENDSKEISLQSRDGGKYYLDVAPIPLEVIAAVAIVMVLDENHFIRQFYTEYECITETPVTFSNK